MWWLVVAAGLAIAEAFTLTFVLALLAVAALAAAGGAAAGLPVAGQVALFAATGAALNLAVGPVARRHLRQGGGLPTGTRALTGRTAVVTVDVSPVGGRVKLGGETWAARSLDPDLEIAVGTPVQVLEVDGSTLVVHARQDLQIPRGDT